MGLTDYAGFDHTIAQLENRGDWVGYYPITQGPEKPIVRAGTHGQTYKMQRAWAQMTDARTEKIGWSNTNTWTKKDHFRG